MSELSVVQPLKFEKLSDTHLVPQGILQFNIYKYRAGLENAACQWQKGHISETTGKKNQRKKAPKANQKKRHLR